MALTASPNDPMLDAPGVDSLDYTGVITIPPSSSSIDMIISKLNWRLMLVCSGIILFSYVDRGNLGLVANDVCHELHLNHKKYGIGVSLFYIGYVLNQLPSNVLIRHFGAPSWLAIILGLWGLIAASFAFMTSLWQFYLLRVLLGIAESGTFPGIWYYITLFYPDRYLAQPYAHTVTMMNLSFPFAALIAAGLIQLDGVFGVDGWRHLFFVEGLLPVCYSFVVFFALPRSIQNTSFLTPEQQSLLLDQKRSDPETKGNELSLWNEIKVVYKHKVFWILTFATLLSVSVYQALTYWLTLIINDMLDDGEDEDDEETCGSSSKHKTTAIVLTAIPFIISSICAFISGRVSIYIKNRTRFYAYSMFLSGLLLSSWVFTKRVNFVFGFLSLTMSIAVYIFAGSILLSIKATLFDQSARATALALFNATAMAGTIFVPPLLGLVVDSYGYSVGIPLLSVLYFFSGLLCLLVHDPGFSNE
eukprot:g7468.t1